MAPKRTRIVGSSSAQPNIDEALDESRFVSLIAHNEYNRLRTRAVAKERGFKPSATDGELLGMINVRGWSVLCDTPLEVPLGVVREFYANAKESANGYSWVRGVTVDYRRATISNVLRLPPQPRGAEDWTIKSRAEVDLDRLVVDLCAPGTEWRYKPGSNEHLNFPASALNRYARAWNMFICARLMPSSHAHDVTVERAILLYGILGGHYIDPAYLIYQGMCRFMTSRTTGAIPHAYLITRLCMNAGVNWGAEEQLQQQSADIDSAIIARLEDWPGGVPHPRGHGFIVGGVERIVPPPQRVRADRAERGAGRQGPQAGFSDTQYRRLLRRMDAMHDINRRFAQDMTVSLDRVFERDGIQVEWPVYGTHQPYPPPDTPPDSQPEEGDDSDD